MTHLRHRRGLHIAPEFSGTPADVIAADLTKSSCRERCSFRASWHSSPSCNEPAIPTPRLVKRARGPGRGQIRCPRPGAGFATYRFMATENWNERTGHNHNQLSTDHALGSLGSSIPTQNPDRKSFSCLVLEDDITIRHLGDELSRRSRHPNGLAARREEASGLLARHQPDLVVLDLRLGQEDGLICCAKSARSPTFP